MGRARAAFNAAKHPRGFHGRFVKAGASDGEVNPRPRGAAAARFAAATQVPRPATAAPSYSPTGTRRSTRTGKLRTGIQAPKGRLPDWVWEPPRMNLAGSAFRRPGQTDEEFLADARSEARRRGLVEHEGAFYKPDDLQKPWAERRPLNAWGVSIRGPVNDVIRNHFGPDVEARLKGDRSVAPVPHERTAARKTRRTRLRHTPVES